VPVGVFTGKSRRAWSISSAHVAFDGIQSWTFGDEIARQKPAPDGILKALSVLGVSPQETLYVGDTISDLRAAAAAGVLPGAALWSKRAHEREAFEGLAAEHGGVAFAAPDAITRLLAGELSPRRALPLR